MATSAEIELRKAQHMNMLQNWQIRRVAIEEESKEQAASVFGDIIVQKWSSLLILDIYVKWEKVLFAHQE